MPKALRSFFHHDRRLFAGASRLIYEILRELYHDQTSQESLADYIARPPISLKKIRYERLSENEEEVDVDARKRARARLLAKVYVPT